MRIDNRALGVFVPGLFAVPQNPVRTGVRPARGTGDFVAGKFAVPQTPVGMGALADFVAGKFAVPQCPVGMGVLVPTNVMYDFPENSVLASAEAAGLAGLGCGCGQKIGEDDCGGCGGQCKSCSGMKGLGTLSTDWSTITTDFSAGNYTKIFSDTILSIPVWGYLAAGVALYMFAGKRR
jgi:hypothetical protein